MFIWILFPWASLLYSGLTISCADRNRSDAQVGAQIDGHERSHSVPSEKPPSGFELYFFTALAFARDLRSIVLTDCDIDTDARRNIDWEDRERKAVSWNLPTAVVWTLHYPLFLSSGFTRQSFPSYFHTFAPSVIRICCTRPQFSHSNSCSRCSWWRKEHRVTRNYLLLSNYLLSDIPVLRALQEVNQHLVQLA